jgi:hypothetical protein
MNSIVVDDELNVSPDQEPTTTPEATGDEPNFAMPDKFAGKSAEEIAQSYLEVEKELGRKNNEVGELRKLTDQFLQQELNRPTSVKEDPKEEAPSVDFDEFVEHPDKVISDLVRRELESVNKRFDEMSVEQRTQKFHNDNPDYQEIAGSKEFYDWAQSSPMRTRTLQAAQSGDFDAADAILQEYRQAAQVSQEKAELAEQKRAQELTDASVETAGTGATSDKVYHRSELMDMYINDPDRYRSMLPEIEAAYAEKRVKS